MNKKLAVTLGLVAALTVTTISAMAETTIYKDALGRMHFLGRDAANNVNNSSNYSNSAEQDLTRKLYEKSEDGMINDTSYDQHPLKNYENTFPDSRFNTSKYWNTKYNNNVDDAKVEVSDTVKGSMTFEKEIKDPSYAGAFGSTMVTNSKTVSSSDNVKTEQTKKKHWWQKK